jgi:HEAT repeat protein
MKLSEFTPSAELAALSNDDLIALFAGAYAPKWHLEYTLVQRTDGLADAAMRGLSHTHPQVRRACGQILDHHGDERCVAALEPLLNDPVDHVRWQSTHALTCVRCKGAPLDLSRRITARLIEMILHDRCTRVRAEALGIFAVYPEALTPELAGRLRDIERELAARPALSKRERAFQRALRALLNAQQ